MKKKGAKEVISVRNKKRNNHKHTTKVRGRKTENKTLKSPKRAKNNIHYIHRQVLSEEDLKTARENILERFKNRPKRTLPEDDEGQVQT